MRTTETRRLYHTCTTGVLQAIAGVMYKLEGVCTTIRTTSVPQLYHVCTTGGRHD